MASKEFDACVSVACSGTKDYLEAMMDKRVSVIVLAEIDGIADGCMFVKGRSQECIHMAMELITSLLAEQPEKNMRSLLKLLSDRVIMQHKEKTYQSGDSDRSNTNGN